MPIAITATCVDWVRMLRRFGERQEAVGHQPEGDEQREEQEQRRELESQQERSMRLEAHPSIAV